MKIYIFCCSLTLIFHILKADTSNGSFRLETLNEKSSNLSLFRLHTVGDEENEDPNSPVPLFNIHNNELRLHKRFWEMFGQDRSGIPNEEKRGIVPRSTEEIDDGPRDRLLNAGRFGVKEILKMREAEFIQKQVLVLDEVLLREMSIGKPGGTLQNPGENLVQNPQFPVADLGVLRLLFDFDEKPLKELAVCNACRVAYGLFTYKLRFGEDLRSMLEKASFACSFFRIASHEVCQGLVARFGPILYYIASKREQMTAEMFCGIVLQSSGCVTNDPLTYWTINFNLMGDYAQKDTIEDNEEVFYTLQREENTPSYKILHLTDVHLDMDYKWWSTAVCDNELCCRDTSWNRSLGADMAGYYGDFRKCDLPINTFENALQHISRTHPDIWIIYMTGDLVPHNVWSTSQGGTERVMEFATNMIRKYFPSTIVIPCLGNHDTSPVNTYSPSGVPSSISTDWVYQMALRLWGQWLPKNAQAQFLRGGFYFYDVSRNLRIVVLNTNLCYTLNFWQTYEQRDPGGQLYWLSKVLKESAENNQFVNILGHVPPGLQDCWKIWSQNYYHLISRYRKTVTAQFFGHTHFDEFRVYYDEFEPSIPFSPMWVGGSLTPYTRLNPGYKIYELDGHRGSKSTFGVVDEESWIFDLAKANQDSSLPPKWYKLYRGTEAYGVRNFLPQSLHYFLRKIAVNNASFQVYRKHFYKGSLLALADPCDETCKRGKICNIIIVDYGELSECLMYNENNDDGDPKYAKYRRIFSEY